MAYPSCDWVCDAHGLVGWKPRFLSRSAASLVNSFSNFSTRISRFEVSIARSCRFMRGARPAAILGSTLPACTSAIRRATRSRTAIALSTVGRGSVLPTVGVLLLRPPIRPSSEALLGLA